MHDFINWLYLKLQQLLMSKISNKLVELKLREVLQLQASADISKFDDNAALNIIFAQYQDRIQFSDAALDRMTEQIEELKLAEVQLRNEVKYIRLKENSLSPHKGNHFNQSQQLDKKLRHQNELFEEQLKKIQMMKNANIELQKKILALVEQGGEKSKLIQDTKSQLQSQRKKEAESKALQIQLREQLARITLQHQQDIQLYKTGFLQNLTKTLKEKSQKESQQHLQLALNLQKKLSQQQQTLKQVIATVNQLFRLKEPVQNQIEGWLAQLQLKFESYSNDIAKSTSKHLKQYKNPIKQLAQHQKKKLQTRQTLLAKYLK